MEVKIDKPILSSSIGKKVLMSVTGLGLTLFLIGHLSGNLLLLKNDGGRAFNEYAEFMKNSPIIWVSEVLIFAGFLIHIFKGIAVTIQNRKARPVRYKVNKGSENSTFYSRFMAFSGITMLLFLIIHLVSFFVKYKLMGQWSEGGYADGDLYSVTKDAFSKGAIGKAYAGFYILCMVLLAFHLAHGVQSATQSLGLQINKKVAKTIGNIGYALAILIPAGFATIPMYFLLTAQ